MCRVLVYDWEDLCAILVNVGKKAWAGVGLKPCLREAIDYAIHFCLEANLVHIFSAIQVSHSLSFSHGLKERKLCNFPQHYSRRQ